MRLMKGSEIVIVTAGLISEKKQVGAFSVDLTVQVISKPSAGGSLDFGGGEYTEAEAVTLEPKKNSPDESYGWWRLEPGSYLVRFNESIDPPSDGAITIMPHERLLAAGGAHPPILVERLDRSVCVLLIVGSGGIAIKENARVSKATVLVDSSTGDG